MLNLGSVVYLKDGNTLIIIVGYPYPQRFNSDEECYFNAKNIEKINIH